MRFERPPQEATNLIILSPFLHRILPKFKNGRYVHVYDNFQCCCQLAGSNDRKLRICECMKTRIERVDKLLEDLRYWERECATEKTTPRKHPIASKRLVSNDLLQDLMDKIDDDAISNLRDKYDGGEVGGQTVPFLYRLAEADIFLEFLENSWQAEFEVDRTATKLFARLISIDNEKIKGGVRYAFALWTTDAHGDVEQTAALLQHDRKGKTNQRNKVFEATECQSRMRNAFRPRQANGEMKSQVDEFMKMTYHRR